MKKSMTVKKLVVAFTFNDEQIAGLSTLSYTINNLIQRIKDFQKIIINIIDINLSAQFFVLRFFLF
jgi:hypothetical protein